MALLAITVTCMCCTNSSTSPEDDCLPWREQLNLSRAIGWHSSNAISLEKYLCFATLTATRQALTGDLTCVLSDSFFVFLQWHSTHLLSLFRILNFSMNHGECQSQRARRGHISTILTRTSVFFWLQVVARSSAAMCSSSKLLKTIILT